MIIDLDKLNPEGERFTGSESPVLMELEDEENVEVREGLQYDLRIAPLGEDLIVRGQLELDVSFRCSRCAEFFETTVRERQFDTVTSPPPNQRSMDLTDDLREAILLAFPSYPLCGAGCKGLCAQCGTNLNKGPCRCQPQLNDQWSALDDFKRE